MRLRLFFVLVLTVSPWAFAAADWPTVCTDNQTRNELKVELKPGGPWRTLKVPDQGVTCRELQSRDGKRTFQISLTTKDKGPRPVCEVAQADAELFVTVRNRNNYVLCETRMDGQAMAFVKNYYLYVGE